MRRLCAQRFRRVLSFNKRQFRFFEGGLYEVSTADGGQFGEPSMEVAQSTACCSHINKSWRKKSICVYVYRIMSLFSLLPLPARHAFPFHHCRMYIFLHAAVLCTMWCQGEAAHYNVHLNRYWWFMVGPLLMWLKRVFFCWPRPQQCFALPPYQDLCLLLQTGSMLTAVCCR